MMPETMTNLTKVQQFYAGQSIFVTGGTGFMGKLLIEKLLRSCHDIACIYLLVRPKKGKTVNERIETLFEDPLFTKLKEEQPNFRHQIVAIPGESGLPDLGISPADRLILIREVSVVFHLAATVNFNEKLKRAVLINIKGSRDIVKLCKEMPKLKVCVHVSTAYSNCPNDTIEEKFYDSPISGKELISFIESLDEEIAVDITKPLLGKWPNTYAFTKALAEDVIRREAGDLPIGVFRPSIVSSTYMEPLRGWTDNMYGVVGVSAGSSMGVLRTLQINGSINSNIIPGDITINATIAVAWDIAEKKKNNENSHEIPIYNYTSKDNPITWDEVKEMAGKYGVPVIPVRAIWCYSIRFTKYKLLNLIYKYLLHLLPALLVDSVTVCIGRKPRMLELYRKVHQFTDAITFFTINDINFTNNNVRTLTDKLEGKDKILFSIDMRNVVWDDYFQHFIKGIRIYLLKDPIDTVPRARVRWQRFYFMHQTIKVLFAYAFLRFIWSAVTTLLSVLS